MQRIFIEVTHSGEWNEEMQDYAFEKVDAPTFFAEDQVQWFQLKQDCVIFGIIGYETAFKTTFAAFYNEKSTIRYIQDK